MNDEVEAMGVKVLEQYALLGGYDFLNIIEAPDEKAVRRIDLRSALKRLRPDQRMVVVLYFYLDLPLAEIATITGASFAAVRGRLYRAIREPKADFTISEAQA